MAKGLNTNVFYWKHGSKYVIISNKYWNTSNQQPKQTRSATVAHMGHPFCTETRMFCVEIELLRRNVTLFRGKTHMLYVEIRLFCVHGNMRMSCFISCSGSLQLSHVIVLVLC